MFTTTLRVLAAAIALGIAGQPAPSLAVEKNAMTYYDTRLVEVYGSPGPVAGSLQLRITPDNIVNGYYRPEGGLGTFIPITGGRDGDNIWFDIGYRGDVHVTARFVKGVIVGTAVDGHDTQYDFTATKAPAQTG
ncbi:MAG: hypothetical protein ACXWNK_11885 [Vulcanimicrobiaceae bacterium]